MAKFLMTVWPITGHIHPNLALAHALRNRGHEVAFYTGAKVQPVVEGEGFRCFTFQQVDAARIEQIVLAPEGILAQARHPQRHKALWRAWVLDTVPAQLADLEQVLAHWSPTMIVCDPSMWAPFLILHEQHQIPVAIFTLVAICLLSGPDGPLLGAPMPRPRTLLGHVRKQVMQSAISLFLADIRRDANALRRQHGLSPIRGSITDFAGQMPLYLVPSSPEFDYRRRDLPPSVEYVGPCSWSKPSALPPLAWLAALPPDQPVVYVTEGTVHLESRILKAAAVGLGHLPIQVIMTTGKHRDPAALDLGPRPLAPNIRVEQWIPLDDLLPKADLIVTTGGPNTVGAALNAHIPLVVIPSDWDHPETGWRIAESGAGLNLAPAECTPGRLRDAVVQVLGDPSFRARASELAHSFARCGGPSRAAALLERVAMHTTASEPELEIAIGE